VHLACLSHTLKSESHNCRMHRQTASTSPGRNLTSVVMQCTCSTHDRTTLSANTEGTQVNGTTHCTRLTSCNSVSTSRLSRLNAFARHGCQDKPRRVRYTAVGLRPATYRCSGHATRLTLQILLLQGTLGMLPSRRRTAHSLGQQVGPCRGTRARGAAASGRRGDAGAPLPLEVPLRHRSGAPP